MEGPRYDTIGRSYGRTRREDPTVAAAITTALGDASSVVNVGAGTGSYEPRDRRVIAIEPSAVMLNQRPRASAPAARAISRNLPLADNSVDAALAVLTIHHWGHDAQRGVREMRRVASGPVVILTIDPVVSAAMWLPRRYAPEVVSMDQTVFNHFERLHEWLGGNVDTLVIETDRDTPDWTFASFWAHPERVLDPVARASTSGFSLLDREVEERVVRAVERDLLSGSWDERYGHLRSQRSFDAGMRLIVSHPDG